MLANNIERIVKKIEGKSNNTSAGRKAALSKEAKSIVNKISSINCCAKSYQDLALPVTNLEKAFNFVQNNANISS